tara:strand:- start:33 stop:464 length:432 start_codon:yes stop_codon:yes gene_type:complete
MSSLTFSDLENDAIDFYQSNANYVKAFGLFQFDREDRLFFNKGKRLSQLEEKSVRASERTWLAEEYDALAAAYVRHAGDRPAILKQFRLFSERHTDNAIDIAAQACRALDTQVKHVKGLTDYANGLLSALQALDQNRFEGVRS